jgi:hypothetical protein
MFGSVPTLTTVKAYDWPKYPDLLRHEIFSVQSAVIRRYFRRKFCPGPSIGETAMLETIAILLIILWLLGLVSSYTLGGFIHVLLVIAVVVIILRIIQGRSPV